MKIRVFSRAAGLFAIVSCVACSSSDGPTVGADGSGGGAGSGGTTIHPKTEEVDYGCDGKVDECVTYTLDSNGRVLEKRQVAGCEGGVSNCWSFTLDADGHVTKEAEDNDCDAVEDSCRTYAYDAHGNVATVKRDGKCDGMDVMTDSYVYTYDANGYVLTMRWSNTLADPFLCASYVRDAKGNVLSYEEDGGSSTSPGCDGKVDRCGAYTYDENGNMLTSQQDWSCDGSVNRCSVYSYDEHGSVLKEEQSCGDKSLKCSSYTY